MKVWLFTPSAFDEYKNKPIDISNEILNGNFSAEPTYKYDDVDPEKKIGIIGIDNWTIDIKDSIEPERDYFKLSEYINNGKYTIIKEVGGHNVTYKLTNDKISNLSSGKHIFEIDTISGWYDRYVGSRIYGKIDINIYDKNDVLKNTITKNMLSMDVTKSLQRLTEFDFTDDTYFYPNPQKEISVNAFINANLCKQSIEFTLKDEDKIEIIITKTWGPKPAMVLFSNPKLSFLIN